MHADKEIEKETGSRRIKKKMKKKTWLNEKVRGKKIMFVGKALKNENILLSFDYYS